MYPDVVLAGGMALVMGTIWAVEQQRYAPQDSALTVLEGLSAVRLLDLTHDGWHSMNTAGWPVLCAVWSVLLAPLPLEGNVYLYKRVGLPALLVVGVLSVLGVVATGVVGLWHSDTDVFYASASSLSYRMQEFNVGVNAAFLLTVRLPAALLTRSVVCEAFSGLALGFSLLWWAELDVSIAPAPGEDAGSCMRLYPRNACLPARHALLCRGCVLGLALVCRRELPAARLGAVTAEAPHGAKTREVIVLRVLCSAVTFCWPVFVAARFAAHIAFGPAVVHSNSATMATVLPLVLITVAAVYDQLVKPRIERFTRLCVGRVLVVGHKAWAWALPSATATLEAAQMLGSPRSLSRSPTPGPERAELSPGRLAPWMFDETEHLAPQTFDETEHLAPHNALQSPLPPCAGSVRWQ